MSAPRPIELVLADLRDEAAILRRRGHVAQADTIDSVCDDVRTAAVEFLTWVSETEAKLRSGRGDDYFRARRQTWAEDGLAELRGRVWYYRRCVVERRKLPSITRAEARRGRMSA